ncbi:MAG: ExbD/TolR family protein [Aquificaceae bacterium]|jgi:biopolymer transport protein ExbD|uniref:ExbD/TolR family protein n=1 Tax=Hydrogenobacter sp. Uz 6-8 TaxID=3384828 RepID=UPI000F1B5945|nr:MAG: biopolymer transporter ExbD [Aquificota bacterium]
MQEREIDYMNVIPLVDVMLVLLTIALIGASFVAVGSLPVNLPSAEHQKRSVESPVELYVDRHGNLYWKGERISKETLLNRLSNYDRNTHIVVGADRDASVQSLVSLLDLLKGMNFQRVSLQVRRT